MGNSCTSVFPNTHACEQQERNKTKRQTDGKKRGVSMERSKAGTNKKSPDGHHIFTKMQYNKHNLLVFNKIWKKHNEIQLTKNKIDLNIQKMNHPPSFAICTTNNVINL